MSAAARLLGLSCSNLTVGMDICLECCVFSGIGPCYGLITRPEEFCRVWCV